MKSSNFTCWRCIFRFVGRAGRWQSEGRFVQSERVLEAILHAADGLIENDREEAHNERLHSASSESGGRMEAELMPHGDADDETAEDNGIRKVLRSRNVLRSESKGLPIVRTTRRYFQTAAGHIYVPHRDRKLSIERISKESCRSKSIYDYTSV